jgi:hypothetical protein
MVHACPKIRGNNEAAFESMLNKMLNVKKPSSLHGALKHQLSVFLVVTCLISIGNLPTEVYAAISAETYSCGGSVEKRAWDIWDTVVRKYISEQFIEKKLLEQGDTYALYDFQTYVHNLASMAMRCQRRERVNEIAKLVEITYSTLEIGSSGAKWQWICRGGAVCNTTNKLVNKEVMLTSVQYLGLTTQLANWFATRPLQISSAETRFVRMTTEVVLDHLLRWGAEREGSTLMRINASPSDVKDGASSLFYTDKDLWLLGIHADLAGILDSDFGKQHLSDLLDSRRKALLKHYTRQLLQL